MDDIRLFTLPPSHRQPEDVGDDYLGLDNSSDTGTIERVPPGERGELSSVEEEASPETATGILAKYLKMNKLPDKERSVRNWLAGEDVVVPETEGSRSGDPSPKNSQINHQVLSPIQSHMY